MFRFAGIGALAIGAALVAGGAQAAERPTTSQVMSHLADSFEDFRYSIELDSIDEPFADIEYGGYLMSIYFYECDGVGNAADRACGSYEIWAAWDLDGRPLSELDANAWNYSKRYLTAYVDEFDDANIAMDVILSSLDRDVLSRSFEIWMDNLLEFAGRLEVDGFLDLAPPVSSLAPQAEGAQATAKIGGWAMGAATPQPGSGLTPSMGRHKDSPRNALGLAE